MTSDRHALWRHLAGNLERAYDAVVRQKQEARVVSIMLRDKQFRVTWASADLGDPTIDRAKIGQAARELFAGLCDGKTEYRSTGVRFDELRPYVPKQTSIFDLDNRTHEKNDRLAVAVDALKRRYGKDVVHRGAAVPVARNVGPEVLFEAR